MRVVKIQRTIGKDKKVTRSTARRSLGQFARVFFAGENQIEFAIEALVFAALLAISAWPLLAAPARLANCWRRQRAKGDRGRPKDGRKKLFA